MLKAGNLRLMNRISVNPHKASFILLAAILLGWLPVNLPLLQAKQDPSSVPVISIPSEEPDYGEMLQGEVIVREFEVKNEGTATLKIWRANPSCSCTKILDFPRSLEPGEKGIVKFEIDSKKVKPGDTRKGITLENNDAERSKIRFIFTAKITSLFETDPNPIKIIGLYRDEKKSPRSTAGKNRLRIQYSRCPFPEWRV